MIYKQNKEINSTFVELFSIKMVLIGEKSKLIFKTIVLFPNLNEI